MSQSAAPTTSTDTRALVIGAGPAGLASAKRLMDVGIRPIVLEAADAVGNEWRHHYRRLHLHTVHWESVLPGMDWPEGTPTYVPRQGVVDY